MRIRLGLRERSVAWCWRSILLAPLIQGCASMSQSECQTADWRTVGYEDGARGALASRIGEYRSACAEHGVSPDLDRYRQGREEGLRQYCRPQNGFRLGEGGAGYASVCPPDLEQDFLAAYQAGTGLYHLAQSVRQTQRHLRSKEQGLAELKMKRRRHQSLLVSEGLSKGRRAELLVEVLEMSRDQGALESEVAQLEAELRRKRHALAHRRAMHAYP